MTQIAKSCNLRPTIKYSKLVEISALPDLLEELKSREKNESDTIHLNTMLESLQAYSMPLYTIEDILAGKHKEASEVQNNEEETTEETNNEETYENNETEKAEENEEEMESEQVEEEAEEEEEPTKSKKDKKKHKSSKIEKPKKMKDKLHKKK